LTFKHKREKLSTHINPGLKIPWLALAVALGLIYFWASPYLMLWNLKTAAQEN
jgi:hypothetical protein